MSTFTGPMTVPKVKREQTQIAAPTMNVYQQPTMEAKTAPVDPMAASSTPNMWANVNPAIGQAYQKNLLAMLDGSAYDPMAAQSREALARYEANQRATSAGRIANAGFAGTPMGATAGQGVENDLAQNRFDNNINIEVNRQLMKNAGMAEARFFASDANTYAAGQADRKGEAGNAFASYAQTHLDLKGMSAEQLMQDQGFASNAQALWESYGGTGKVPPQWAKYQLDAANDPRLNDLLTATNYQVDQWVSGGIMSADDGQLVKDFAAQGLFQNLKRDPETGKVVIDLETVKKTAGVDESYSFDPMTDSAWSSEADKLVRDAKVDDPSYEKIIEQRAQDVINGDKAITSAISSALGKNDPVYKQLLSMNAGLNGYGSVGEVNPPGAGNDRHSYTNLESAYNDKGLIRDNGDLWEVTGRSVKKKNWKNWTVYTLRNPATGETKSVTAKG